MRRSGDPFERAVERERALRDRAALFDSPTRFLKLYWRVIMALGVVWAALLAAHWAWWSSPHLLVVVHTIVFGLLAVFSLATRAFMAFVMRRRPDWFPDFQT